MTESPVLVEVWRGAYLESQHRGIAVVVDSEGRQVAAWGDVSRPIFPRSSFKPLQAFALLKSGAEIAEKELALACGSHSGAPEHTKTVAAWLKRLGLSEDDLECGSHLPVSEKTAHALLAKGLKPCPLHHNCSGKHAGFLTLALQLGVPTKGYLKLDHPVQQKVRAGLEHLAGMALVEYGTDGCGIPAFRIPLDALARSMVRLAEEAKPIVSAMRAHPLMVAGLKRFDTEIMETVPGVAAKGGAEAVQVMVLPEKGLGIALKIDDGGERARDVAAAAILDRLGVLEGKGRDWLSVPIHGTVAKNIADLRPGAALKAG